MSQALGDGCSLVGNYLQIVGEGAPAPLVSERNRRLVARRILELLLPYGWFPPPRTLADVLGYRLAVLTPTPEALGPPSDVLTYLWDRDPRLRGAHVYRAIARAELAREGYRYTTTDAELLAIDLAVPLEVSSMELTTLVDEQQHFPVEMIRIAVAIYRADA